MHKKEKETKKPLQNTKQKQKQNETETKPKKQTNKPKKNPSAQNIDSDGLYSHDI